MDKDMACALGCVCIVFTIAMLALAFGLHSDNLVKLKQLELAIAQYKSVK